MLSITHAALSVATVCCVIGTADPLVLGVAAIASQLPDVDTTKSYTGLILYPVARWIEDRYAHRTVTHSFIATSAVAVLALPLWFWLSWQYWAALSIGYFMGWFADCFTKAGVAAFYPNPARLVIPGNPKARLRSGSSGEYWLLATAIAIVIIASNIISNGGVSETFARSFFRDADTASDMFKRYGSNQQIFVEVEGIHNVTNQKVKGNYKIIAAAAESSVLAQDDKGVLYQIGNDPASQIKPIAVETKLGEKLTIKSTQKNIENQFVVDMLKELPKAAYISGSLFLDDLTDLKLPIELERFSVLAIYAGQIELRNATPDQILDKLGEMYIIAGQIIVKVRSDETN
jgi:inner membrane protein